MARRVALQADEAGYSDKIPSRNVRQCRQSANLDIDRRLCACVHCRETPELRAESPRSYTDSGRGNV